MKKAVTYTNFDFPNQKSAYKGKVRDTYNIDDKYLIMVVSDRVSAFDKILPAGIPYKGQVLNQIASEFLDATTDILPNWKIAVIDPMVSFGRLCEPFQVEMVIRGYLSGHAWREYKQGKREICGVSMPDGMKENDRFPQPIITPTTKAAVGHDEDISKEKILELGLVSKEDYENLEKYTLALFNRGSEMSEKQGLILVDTKYEFGKSDGEIFLIDEIHTPDSSRYFYKEGYLERQNKNLPQRQLSKEFLREWLMENGFSGLAGEKIPEMNQNIVNQVSERYIELFEKITGHKFEKDDSEDVSMRIEKNIKRFLKAYNR